MDTAENDKEFLHDPIEEFQDPTSEVSLFLSKKIQAEIATRGEIKVWSSEIEKDFLKRVLPDFKKHFPTYRLGIFALRKAFEKAAYYYEKLYGTRSHLQEEMNFSSLLYDGFEIHAQTKLLVAKMSECVAALQGKRINQRHLSAKIFSALNHTQVTKQKKNPYHSYGAEDLLIVKTLLEALSSKPTLTAKDLLHAAQNKLSLIQSLKEPYKSPYLETAISICLAKKFRTSLTLPPSEERVVEMIIDEERSEGCRPLEIVQRLEILIEAARLHAGKKSPRKIDEWLLEKINEEISLEFQEYKDSFTLDQIQRLQKLPSLLVLPKTSLKPLLFSLIEEPLDSQIVHLIDSEITNVLLENPTKSFQEIVLSTLRFFKQAQDSLHAEGALNERIEFWASQHELSLSEITFPENPFLDHLKSNFMAAMQAYPHLAGFEKEIRKRVWIYERYLSYKERQGSTFTHFEKLRPGEMCRAYLNLYPDFLLAEKVEPKENQR